ncbi:protein-L-isoaspartate O-methyltransferase [Microvirga tunisiensis]|uniref:Protein-L-isoaspartate O-methyltransferase n=2 Tax=Pannonibacter tanglangensis TaxID=2750084 RepID=A0ABW9ZGT3_9HYPH|nr:MULTISPECIES: protein-L-isoaspartate O-methyltransferase [unclassified Pannonibacter]NBN62369.1 protein-L-isoaspartate O-methyltransferase [Pannonibacter sp. XCT-34]NBN78036.1 protein-L-isoaspartate O-methyltransferase [Pannonibacter sp. XCT-53]
MGDYAQSRTRMVDNQLRTNDVTDLRILDAMEATPRELFVASSKRPVAYIDEDILVSDTGTPRYMMKPHVCGKLIQLALVRPGDVVLVVGGTTGYTTAVLARLAGAVVMVEEDAALAARASQTLVSLGIENAAVIEGKLTEGCASEGPYDVILLDGAVEFLPEALAQQLKPGGRLVAIEGLGRAGVARLYQDSGAAIGARFGFNASAHLLPGFEKASEFVF